MTEAEWLTCTDLVRMLRFLEDKASERKLRLFACACCRRFWHLLTDERSRKVVEIAEQYADELATEEVLVSAGDAALDASNDAMTSAHVPDAVASAASAACNLSHDAVVAADYAAAGMVSAAFHMATSARAASAATAREAERAAQCSLLRESFRYPFRPRIVDPFWLRWNDGTVVRLAQSIYDTRDFSLMPILADALEDAGCDNADILNHCRQPGEHVRGCWVIDLLLGKS